MSLIIQMNLIGRVRVWTRMEGGWVEIGPKTVTLHPEAMGVEPEGLPDRFPVSLLAVLCAFETVHSRSSVVGHFTSLLLLLSLLLARTRIARFSG